MSLPNQLQVGVISSEVSVAKTYAIKNNTLTNGLQTDVNILRAELYANEASLNEVIAKMRSLCDILNAKTALGLGNVDYDDLPPV